MRIPCGRFEVREITVAALLFGLLCGGVRAQDVLYLLNGDFQEDRFGYSVAGAGDVNADGFADLVIGAIDDDNNGLNSGSARVVSGKNGAILYTFNGDGVLEEFGWAVSGAGDVNADGYADVIVGAPQALNTRGYARVFSGKDGSIIRTVAGQLNGDQFGCSVSDAGDVNGDGYADFTVGAFEESGGSVANGGVVRVFCGKTGAYLRYFQGPEKHGEFGWSVSCAGDVILDGFPDILAGAPEAGTGGRTYVLSGQNGAVLHTLFAAAAFDRFGASVSGIGDIDHNGFADVFVGAPKNDSGGVDAGSSYAYSGITGQTLFSFAGGAAGDRFGTSVGGGGDVDGDTFPDLVVGAPGDDVAFTDAGAVVVLSGQSGISLYRREGDSAADELGGAVGAAGDVNTDGFADWIAGASKDDPKGNLSGSAVVLSRPCGKIASYGTGCAGSGGFVPTLGLSGCVAPGGSLLLEVKGGLGGSLVIFFFGPVPVSMPMNGGCTLLVSLTPLLFGAPSSGSGAGNGGLTVGGTIPAGAAVAGFAVQAFVADPGVAQGFANTNGIQVTL